MSSLLLALGDPGRVVGMSPPTPHTLSGVLAQEGLGL